jgi:membrane protease subunit (stomatin/prohibitin family)
MGLWDKLTGEFIDIIEWTDNSQDTLVYRFERHGNEIKNGAKLTVRETQTAIFVNEGTMQDKNSDGVADVFTPGMYTLETKNLPILTTLKGWKYGFNSPFKAEVYFVNTKQFINQGWGTKHEFTIVDSQLKKPIRLKAFGTYAFKIKDPVKLIKAVIGTDGKYNVDEISDQLRNIITVRFTDTCASSGIPIFNLAANFNELSDEVVKNVNADFDELGLAVTKLFVENISFPPEIEAAIDKSGSIGIIGDLNAFNQYQMGTSMEKAAENPNGSASGGIGVGMGFMMSNNMMNNNQQNQNNNQQNNNNMPPPPPPVLTFYVAAAGQQTGPFDIATLTTMLKAGTFNKESQVWKQGMTAWTAAGQVPDLAQVFNSVPPPIPG